MAGVPINFAIPSEGATASYSWTDISNGLGYIDFYLYPYYVEDTKYWGLNPAILISKGDGFSSYNTTTTNKFYTSVFNTPRTLQGDVYFSFGSAAQKTTSGSANYTVAVSIYKVETDTTEVQIGTTCTKTLSTSGSSAINQANTLLLVSSISSTNIKIGEKLMVQVSITNAAFKVDFGTSPANLNYGLLTPESSSSSTTISKLSVPFKINI